MFDLRDYQKNCIDAINQADGNGTRKQLVALPTGTGKTIIFSELIKQRGGRSLILAHRDELCRQANDKLTTVFPSAKNDIGWVKAKRNEVDKAIIIGSVQTLRESRLRQLPSFDTIITDEAHHAVADSYLRIYDALVTDNNLHCGFTATPNRRDRKGLGEVFDEVVYEKQINDMIEAGWLCKLRGERITTDISIDHVHTLAGDFNRGELTSVINTQNRNNLIVEAWQEHASERKTLAFTVDIKHAIDLAECFREAGVTAEAISGKNTQSERHELEHQFHTGDIQVLCNCYLLTEGYDEPAIDCILLARPTKSQSLHIQMVGRGTRPLPEKENCLILDVVDNTTKHDIRQFADLGLEPPEPTGIAPDGTGSEKERFKNYGTGDDVYSEEVDLFGRMADYDWIKLDADVYHLSLGDGYIRTQISRKGTGYYAVFTEKGTWEKTYLTRGTTSLGWAISTAEDFAIKRMKGQTTLIDKNARWKQRPASVKQVKFAKTLGINTDIDATQGELSAMIEKRKYENYKQKWF